MGGQGRARTADPTLFRRVLYQLSYLTRCCAATPTGLEPATSAVTGRRANQLRYGAWMVLRPYCCAPNGIRTRVATLKGWSPGPLDDGDQVPFRMAAGGARTAAVVPSGTVGA